MILYAGYLGITRSVLGDPARAVRTPRACAAFDETASKFEGEQRDDAVFGVAQLRWVAGKFRPDVTVTQR